MKRCFTAGLALGVLMTVGVASQLPIRWERQSIFGKTFWQGNGQITIAVRYDPRIELYQEGQYLTQTRDALLAEMDSGHWDEEMVIVYSDRDEAEQMRQLLLEQLRFRHRLKGPK